MELSLTDLAGVTWLSLNLEDEIILSDVYRVNVLEWEVNTI